MQIVRVPLTKDQTFLQCMVDLFTQNQGRPAVYYVTRDAFMDFIISQACNHQMCFYGASTPNHQKFMLEIYPTQSQLLFEYVPKSGKFRLLSSNYLNVVYKEPSDEELNLCNYYVITGKDEP